MPGVGYELRPPRSHQGDPDYSPNPQRLTVFHGCFCPSTTPEAIAAVQLADVREAVKRLGREDLAAISAATDLSLWTVQRRIAELFGEKRPKTKVQLSKVRQSPIARGKFIKQPQAATKLIPRIVVYLTKHGPTSVPVIAKALGVPSTNVGPTIAKAFRWFRRVGTELNPLKQKRKVWGLLPPLRP